MAAPRAARHYAQALFDLAAEQDALAATGSELDLLATLAADHDVVWFSREPRIPAAKRHAVLQQAVSGCSELTRSFLRVVLQRGRLTALPAIRDAFRTLLDRRHHRLRVRAVSAVPLRDPQVRALTQQLQQLTGREIVLAAEVDRALIGGLVVEADGWQYDGSVARAFRDLRDRLQHISLGTQE